MEVDSKWVPALQRTAAHSSAVQQQRRCRMKQRCKTWQRAAAASHCDCVHPHQLRCQQAVWLVHAALTPPPPPLSGARCRWQPNKALEAKKCYGTSSLEHPGVQMISMERGKWYIGGKVHGLAIPKR